MHAWPCVTFSASSFSLSFGNVKIILNNPNTTFELLTFAEQRRLRTLSVFIIFDRKANFPLIILKTSLSIFIQLIVAF